MALPVNIDDLINHRKVESARIEYKAGWNPEKVAHTICAFANDIDNWGGGYVILGVAEENGRPVFPVVGLDPGSIDGIQKELLNVCHLIEPVCLPVVEPCVYEGKPLLVIWIPGGCDRPYKCPERILKDGKSPKVYYIRKLASTVKASAADEKELFELSGDVPFDDRPNMRADITDLKLGLIADYLHEVKSELAEDAEEKPVAELARDMQIAMGPPECFKPKNVGLLFFNPHPENFFRCAWIDVVDKPDPTGEGMVEKRFTGPLHVQLRSALDYIRNRFLCEKIFKHDDRAEADRFWNYPYRAIEEALANAVYHKSYRIAEPITVTVTPTEMTISSLPGPERSISDEDLKKFHMIGLHYRNRRIGDFLKELELVEGRNTGVPVIVRAMRHNGSPDPVFSAPETRDWISVVLPVHRVFKVTISATSEKLAPNVSPIDPEKLEKSAVMTSNEEIVHLKAALNVALKLALIKKADRVVERMARELQEMLRNPRLVLDNLASMLKASPRIVDMDVALMKKIGVLNVDGQTKASTWRVVLMEK